MPKEEFIFGLHAVKAALKYEPDLVRILWLDKDRRDPRLLDIQDIAKQRGISTRDEPRATLDRMTGGARHQGVVAACTGAPVQRSEQDIESILASAKPPALLLALDQVQDPHNLGACLRSAEAAGVNAVIAPRDNSASLTATVRKVACGAAETVPFIQVVNLSRCLESLKKQDLWIVGADMEADKTLYDVDFKMPTVIVLGAEEKGLRRLTRETCDILAKIPMMGKVETLNVSVATGIFLFETLRQRRAGTASNG
jgi:23S rRNA (guanosine2251-2'-O)-methyltransferase